jgi:hypothetical protein
MVLAGTSRKVVQVVEPDPRLGGSLAEVAENVARMPIN